MNSKTTLVLVLALLMAVAGLWWLMPGADGPVADDAEQSRKLLSLDAIDVTAYEIKSGDEAACSFVKDGDQWRMTAPITGPVQAGTVSSDISQLVDLEYEKSYPKGADAPGDDLTSLDKPKKIIKLTDADGKAHILRIGNPQTLSTRTYVSMEGDDHVYLVDMNLNKTLKRKLADYRGKRVVEIKASDAVRVEVLGDESFTAVKNGAKWTIESPEKARADLARLTRVINGIANLNVTKFVEDDPRSLRPFGLEQPRLTVKITTETTKTPDTDATSGPAEPTIERTDTTVAFGAAIEGNVFARLVDGASTTVFQVGKTTLDSVSPKLSDVRDKRIADLIPIRVQTVAMTSQGGETMTISRSGAEWLIPPADATAVSEKAERVAINDLLNAVRDLKAVGFEKEDKAEFGFDAPRMRLRIEAEGGVEPIELIVGALTPSQTGAYIKNEREDFVAVVSADDAMKLIVEPIAFRSRDILSINVARVSRLSLRRPSETLVLERQGDGWQMTAPIDARANAAAVDAFLGACASLKGREVVATTSARGRFGLAQPQYTVEFTVNKPTPTTQPASADGPAPPESETIVLFVSRHEGKRYAMLQGGALIYEVEEKLPVDIEKEYLDTRVLSFDPKGVKSIAYAGETTFKFSREDSSWSLEGEPTFATSPPKIDALLKALSELTAQRYAAYENAEAGAFGLAPPRFRVRIEMADGITHELVVSGIGPNAADRYAQLASDAGRAFVLTSIDVAKFDKLAADFKK